MSSQGATGSAGYAYPPTRDAQDWTRQLKEQRLHKSYENPGGDSNTDMSPPWMKFGNGVRLSYNFGHLSCLCQAGCYGNAFNGSIPIPNPEGDQGLALISNLQVASYSGPSNYPGQGTSAVLTWDEMGGHVTSRTFTVTQTTNNPGDYVNPNSVITSYSAGSCTVEAANYPDNGGGREGPYNVTVTLSNSFGSSSSTITVSVTCFLGFVKLQTRGGPICASDIKIGMEMLQPNGSYSKVTKVKETPVTKFIPAEDARLFADPEEKMVVTSWHKIRFSDELEETKADVHPRLHEVFREMPFTVYNFQLDKFSDKIMIHDTDIIAESFIPINPMQ